MNSLTLLPMDEMHCMYVSLLTIYIHMKGTSISQNHQKYVHTADIVLNLSMADVFLNFIFM